MSIDPHPIDPQIRRPIDDRLVALERQHDIRILLAVESGSRGWGFASPDSDYDVRFIYVHPRDWYLTLTPGRDVIEEPISEDLDISGWDLKKALALQNKGNVTVAEWLDSPVIYRADKQFCDDLTVAIRETHRSERAINHYISVAKHQLRGGPEGTPLRLKRFLYSLRSVLAATWVELNDSAAPMRLETLVDAVVTDSNVRFAITQTVEIKRTSLESSTAQVPEFLITFVLTELQRLTEYIPQPGPPVDPEVLNRVFRTMLH